jgi:hypothetical protein
MHLRVVMMRVVVAALMMMMMMMMGCLSKYKNGQNSYKVELVSKSY